jgi:TRAP-type C4-dicarboxylate transport system permease small subunit
VSEIPKPLEAKPKSEAPQSALEKKVNSFSDKIFTSPFKITKTLGSGLIMVTVLLMTTDVAGRYLFKHPIQGSDELVGFLILCTAAFAFSYAQREKQHLRVDVLIDRLRGRTRDFFDLFALILGLGVSIIISWQMFEAARKYILGLQGGPQLSWILGIPYFPFLLVLGVGYAVYALAVFTDAVTLIIKVARR